MRRRRVLVAVFAALPLHCFAQASSNPTFSEQWDACIPSADVKAALDALPEQTRAQTEWDVLQQQLAAIQQLRRQFPGNVFVERRYMFTMLEKRERGKIIEESEAKFTANRDSPLLAYLYGFSLLGRRSSESERLFEDALQKDPKFPWPHLQLEWIYSSPVFRDKRKSDSHLRAFLNECPEAFEGYEQLSRTAIDKELIQESAARLRSVLGRRTDADAIAAYQTLWALEFKAAPTSEYAPLREKVKQDIARIRALHLEDKRQWYDALEQGYKLTNDLKNAEWAKDERETRYPSAWAPASLGKWLEDHPPPADDAPVETRRAYNKGLLAQASKWSRDYPNATFIWGMRLDALTELDGVTPEEIEKAADQFIGAAQKNAGPIGPGSSEYFRVARALSKEHLQPERVIEMARRGLEASEAEEKDQSYDLFSDAEHATEFRFYNLSERLAAMGYMAKGQLALERAGEAEITLSRMDERLQDMKSLATDKNDRQESYLEQVSVYWECSSRLAQLQRRNVDAMGFYENALLARLEARRRPIPGKKDELAEDARQLWSMLGGTNEGWMMWYGRRANELAKSVSLRWENTNEPLPDFQLADLNGKIWTQESLKGKVTFLNFWASW
jgi:hypothetical protein